MNASFCNYFTGNVKRRKLPNRSFLMTRHKRKTRTTVIQHTSMVSMPVTVDLCSPLRIQNSSSCIDLTNDTDENEIVDLTTQNDSVVCLATSSEPQTGQSQRNKQHNAKTSNQPINVDTVDDDDDSNTEDVLPVFDCGAKSWNKQKREESAKKKITCPICYDDVERIEACGKQLVSTVCGHLFCDYCIRESIRTQRCCPNCRKKLTMKQFHPIFI